MQKYQDVALDTGGRPISNGLVTVTTLAGAATTIYSDNGTTVITELRTGSQGQYAFYAADGRYSIQISGSGITTKTLTDILLEDPVDKNVVNVLLNSVAGDGSTDDTAAIQAVIDANPGKSIFFPDATYKLTGTIYGRTDRTRLFGGPKAIFVQYTPNIDTIVFEPTTAGTTSAFLNFPEIEGFTISTASTVYGSHTSGAAVKFRQCNGYKYSDVTINDSAEGLVVMGGQFGSIRSPKLYASQGSYLGAGSALIHFREAAYGASYQPCYTVDVWDPKGTASLLRDAIVRVSNGDGLAIHGGYIANAKTSNVLVLAERDTSTVSALQMIGVYNDCVSTGRTVNGVEIRDDGFASSVVYMVRVLGGIIGNGDGRGVLCRKTNTYDITVDGTSIINMGLWAVDVEGSTSKTDLSIVGGTKLQNCGDGTSGVIRASTGRTLSIGNGTQFVGGNATICAKVDGTWGTVNISGANNSDNIPELDTSTATITYKLTVAGNVGRDTAAATSWSGTRASNLAVTDPLRLDWYEEGTFTPAITFGGAAVGITYTSQFGKFTRIGNRVFFSAHVILSSKGSSTGSALITGLPYASGAGATEVTPSALRITSITAGVGDQFLAAFPQGTTTTIRIDKIASGSTFVTQLTDADLSNTTSVAISGNYSV